MQEIPKQSKSAPFQIEVEMHQIGLTETEKNLVREALVQSYVFGCEVFRTIKNSRKGV